MREREDGALVFHKRRRFVLDDPPVAWVPSHPVETVGDLSGSGADYVTYSVAGADRTVISGFSFDFSSADHHIDQMGISSGSSSMDIHYSDWNGDDSFDDWVKYARLTQ